MENFDDLLNDTLNEIEATENEVKQAKVDEEVTIEDGNAANGEQGENWEDDARKALEELFKQSDAPEGDIPNLLDDQGFKNMTKDDAEGFAKFMQDLGGPSLDGDAYLRLANGQMDEEAIQKLAKMFGLLGDEDDSAVPTAPTGIPGASDGEDVGDLEKMVQAALKRAGAGEDPSAPAQEGCTQQ